MSTPHFAFVTLVTTDQYLPGALAVAASLRELHPSPPTSIDELDPCNFHVICLVTPETVSVQAFKLLRRSFDIVIGVEVIQEDTEEALNLLGRPDLNTALTKLHVFRLKSYRKIIYLDADVLPLLPLSHLFNISSSFAAVPDVGWPDIFNSGVFVFAPGEEDYEEIMQLVKSQGSWDGADQGVLNEWRGNDWERLSFTYNTTPTAAYTYAPAYNRFGSCIKVIHFIGPNKPWSQLPFRGVSSQSSESPTVASCPQTSYAYSALLDRWFTIFDKHYRSPTAPVFSTTGSILPGDAFQEKIYTNAWDSDMSDSVDAMGLDALKQLALEGLGQIPTKVKGEGAYMTLPLEGRIDLMPPQRSRLPKFVPPQDPAMHILPRASSTDSSSSYDVKTPVDALQQNLASVSVAEKPRSPVALLRPWDPWTRTYPNAWDLVPGIERYARQRAMVMQKATLMGNEAIFQRRDGKVYNSWEDYSESTSRDGDDEAEEDDAIEAGGSV